MVDTAVPSAATVPVSAPRPRPRLPWRDLLVGWASARVVVLAALALAAFVRRAVERRTHVPMPSQGLLGWDAGWYLQLTRHGYAHTAAEAIRFFPALPLTARGLSWVLLGSAPAALLLLSNAAALGYAFLLHRLAVVEGLGADTGVRTAWAAAFAPAGFVLVMGYAEALVGCLVVACMLAARTDRWVLAAGIGLAAGATRPTGVLLSVFLLVEAVRLRPAAAAAILRPAAAVVAPAVGLGGFLAWAGLRYGDPWLPLREQTAPGLRAGVLVNPLTQADHVISGLSGGGTIGSAMHLPWIALACGLLVVVVRRLPVSYTALAVPGLVLAATGQGFASFERYAASSVPLLLAAGLVLGGRIRSAAALSIGSAVLFGYALLAFLHLYVP